MSDRPVIRAEGRVLIRDGVTGEVLVQKNNAIHYENLSEAIALALANRVAGTVHEMSFGNGASTVSGTGAITYFPPNVLGAEASLYNQTYSKVINDQSPLNTDITRNNVRVSHASGDNWSDMIVTCFLDYNEPVGQAAFDDVTQTETPYIFDEIGLRAYTAVPGTGKLLTHVVFHPVQKSLNRTIEVVYTLRIYMS